MFVNVYDILIQYYNIVRFVFVIKHSLSVLLYLLFHETRMVKVRAYQCTLFPLKLAIRHTNFTPFTLTC